MDAGIASEDNRRWSKESYRWLCISKEVRKAPPDRAPDSTLRSMA